MTCKDEYQDLFKTVMKEHLSVFEAQDVIELEQFMDLIVQADRIFCMGVGREGISTRGFAMRLMHLGKEVHWIWDDTTPGMHKGDLFIATNEQAKKSGATVAIVRGSANQVNREFADFVLFVPASVFNGTDSRAVKSIQPMGNLFEQHLYMLFDIIVIMLERRLKLSHEAMEARHRNVE